jgi:hypothetical protein
VQELITEVEGRQFWSSSGRVKTWECAVELAQWSECTASQALNFKILTQVCMGKVDKKR